MAVLYRDYRPKQFAEVVNQDHIKRTLQNAVAKGAFAHAYLFTGMRGTGKTSIARIFARAINCPNQKDGEPCNNCDICNQFLNNSSMDLVEIDAASNTGVENIRELIEGVKFSPSQAKYKVFIIDEVHMLSKGAFNALLKTLEEPPAHAVFILATTEIHKVPLTVVSRTQRFDFKKLLGESLLAHLKQVAKSEKIEIDDASLQLVVQASDGSARDALSILGKLASFGAVDLAQAEKILGVTSVTASHQVLQFIIQKDSKSAIEFLHSLFADGIEPSLFNKNFLEYLRNVLLSLMGAPSQINSDVLKLVEPQSKSLNVSQLLLIIRLFMRAHKDFSSSPNPELPLEIAVAESCLSGSSTVQTVASVTSSFVNNSPSVKTVNSPKTVNSSSMDSTFDSSPVVKSAFSMPDSTIQAISSEIEADNTSEELTSNGAIIGYEQVVQAWPEVLQQIRNQASALLTVMKSAKLKSVSNNTLCLSFAYKFHKDSVENQKNRLVLQKILHQKFGTRVGVEVILEKQEKLDVSDAVEVAMDVFAGEIA
jgi:DNA polymerase III subunit gamma/tau